MSAQLKTKDQVLEGVKAHLGALISQFGAFKDCDWLAGDASNRFYGRLKFEKSNLILMVMNAPEAFKSEEVTGAAQGQIKELPFVSVGRAFEKAKVRVPHIYFISPASDFLITEDLGDELLYQRRQNSSALDWYEKALDELALIQKVSPTITPHKFTTELLSWEFEHFMEYALIKRDKKLSDSVAAEIRKFGSKIVGRMASSSYVLVHRDYHSKNLLVLDNEKKIGVIDFQDALMGPPTYDLASLLRDSYVALSDEEENRLLQYFETVSGTKIDRELFGYTSLQRNLKAVGRFYYISMVKGKDTHLPYVKPSLHRIFKTLKQIGELRALALLEGLMSHEAS